MNLFRDGSNMVWCHNTSNLHFGSNVLSINCRFHVTASKRPPSNSCLSGRRSSSSIKILIFSFSDINVSPLPHLHSVILHFSRFILSFTAYWYRSQTLFRNFSHQNIQAMRYSKYCRLIFLIQYFPPVFHNFFWSFEMCNFLILHAKSNRIV